MKWFNAGWLYNLGDINIYTHTKKKLSINEYLIRNGLMVHTLYVHISYLIILDYLFPILLYASITGFCLCTSSLTPIYVSSRYGASQSLKFT